MIHLTTLAQEPGTEGLVALGVFLFAIGVMFLIMLDQ